MSHPRLRRLWIAVPIILLSVLTACSWGWLERTRAHTYPPGFNYITDEKLQTTMWRLAAEVSSLDRILGQGEVPNEQGRLQVVSILSRMESVSMELGPQDWSSNHPRVARNVGRFRKDVANARRAVQVDPPSYYLAGSISGACLHCHGDE